jgi:hypothetical protein
VRLTRIGRPLEIPVRFSSVIERDRPSSRVPAEVQGFFVVSAASLEEAAAVARSSPHVRDGGRIVVRPIDTP